MNAPSVIIGFDPGPRYTAGSYVRYVGNVDDYDTIDNYRIEDFWIWELRKENKSLQETSEKLLSFLQHDRHLDNRNAVVAIESQEGGNIKSAAFLAPRNHSVAGIIFGFASTTGHRTIWVSKREKWPCNNKDKKSRVSYIKYLLSRSSQNSNLRARYLHLLKDHPNAPRKIFEDVADAILVAVDRLRKLLLEFSKEKRKRVTKTGKVKRMREDNGCGAMMELGVRKKKKTDNTDLSTLPNVIDLVNS
jgi:hypothetical protein